MTIHNLKIDLEYLIPIMRGTKTFEVRLNDRNYQVGDILHLRHEQEGIHYFCEVIYIHSGLGLKKDHVCMSIRKFGL